MTNSIESNLQFGMSNEGGGCGTSGSGFEGGGSFDDFDVCDVTFPGVVRSKFRKDYRKVYEKSYDFDFG